MGYHQKQNLPTTVAPAVDTKAEMVTHGHESSYFWYKIFPTFPPTLMVGAGFLIFHRLALRRQKRSEIFDTFRDLKEITEQIYRSANDAWGESGVNALKEGKVTEVRQKLTRAREELRLLINLDKRFSGVSEAMNEFRKAVDEEVDESNIPVSTIDDLQRSANHDWPVNGITPKATALRQKLNQIFARIYK